MNDETHGLSREEGRSARIRLARKTDGSGPLRHQYDLPIVGHPAEAIRHLNAREVLDIHYQLVVDFAESPDPIDPAGVRGDGELLESALTRPLTSLARRLKYPTIEMAAAALLHALVLDHPFHNGNKRTAIVALLVFLDKNGYVLAASEDDLFEYVINLASHKAPVDMPANVSSISDQETLTAAVWIDRHVRKLNRAQHAMRWKDLEGTLRRYDCTFEERQGNMVVIRRGNLAVHTGRRNAGSEMDTNGVAHVRKKLQLDEEHGVDSFSFYHKATPVPDFINKYRTLLRRLAPY